AGRPLRMRLRPWSRILAPKDNRKMVYAITMSEALRLETVSNGLIVLTDWLTNPARSSQKRSQIGSRPRRGATGFSWPLYATERFRFGRGTEDVLYHEALACNSLWMWKESCRIIPLPCAN